MKRVIKWASAALLWLTGIVGAIVAAALHGGWWDDVVRVALQSGLWDDAARVGLKLILETKAGRAEVGLLLDQLSLSFKLFWTLLKWAAGVTAVLALLAGLPLLWSGLRRRKPSVFVSFQHAHEALAVAVSDALAAAGFSVRRVRFEAGADHQRVLSEMQRQQRGAHALVCLPGDAQSVVDAEVYAAAVALQPVVFLVRPHGASLPNAADKRYPVMRLDVLQELGWAPLAELLHHVTLDFRSTCALYGQALRHPLLGLTMAPIVAVLMLVALALFGLAVAHGLSETAGLGGASALLRGQAIAVHAGVLALGALPLLAIMAYLALVIRHVAVQFRAASQASLQAGEAAFSREDWLGLIPGLEVGQPLYRALLEQAPLAHHERARPLKRPHSRRQARA